MSQVTLSTVSTSVAAQARRVPASPSWWRQTTQAFEGVHGSSSPPSASDSRWVVTAGDTCAVTSSQYDEGSSGGGIDEMFEAHFERLQRPAAAHPIAQLFRSGNTPG